MRKYKLRQKSKIYFTFQVNHLKSGIVTLMSSWFCRNLGDALMALEPLDHIQTLFQSAYPVLGSPKDVAVFVRHNSEGHLHCQVEVYVSPASVLLAKEMDAEPCDRPSINGLVLLIGSEDSWSTLFPEDRA